MTSGQKTWESLKAEYLHQVEKALSSVRHPRKREVLEDVRSHLDRRFAELKPDEQTWENFQAIITGMGPASDYAELLDPEAVPVSRSVSRKYLWYVSLAAVVIISFVILLPIIKSNKVQIITSGQDRIEDKIDYPFVNDPQVIGTWKSVDFVETMEQFNPDRKHWRGGDLFLKELVFLPGGKTNYSQDTWTKGLWLDPGSKTASRYIIKEMDGSKYMFFEWKSGDYTIRGMKPKYYVLKKD
jgi:hypothetical protein